MQIRVPPPLSSSLALVVMAEVTGTESWLSDDTFELRIRHKKQCIHDTINVLAPDGI